MREAGRLTLSYVTYYTLRMISTLDALLLFLVGIKSQSGYDIRQVFLSTPLGLFSDSPGAIYPALARLEKNGLLSAVVEPGGRRKRVFELTVAGQTALDGWLRQPVTAESVKRRQVELDLRYVLTGISLGDAAARRLLHDYVRAYDHEIKTVEAYCAGPGKTQPAASRQVLALGLRLQRTRRDWANEILDGGSDEDETRMDHVDMGGGHPG